MIKKCAIVAILSCAASATFAEAVPPACAQFVAAYETCFADIERWVAVNKPQNADSLRSDGVTVMTGLRATIRKLIRDRGYAGAAQQCAASESKKAVIDGLIEISKPIEQAGGRLERCHAAAGNIQ